MSYPTREHLRTLYRQRVVAGVAWLDQEFPGWRARVRPEALIMSDPCRCVLGQVTGRNQVRECERLGVDGGALGFDLRAEGDGLPCPMPTYAWETLQNVWLEELAREPEVGP